MRFWPFRRARPALRTSPDDVLVTEVLLHSAVADVFAVRDRRVFGGVIAYRGHLLVAPADAVDRLVARFRPFGFTPFLRAEEGDVILQALPLTEPVVRPRIGLNIALFVMTCFTTLVSGAFLFASPTFTPLGNSGLIAALLTGAPFAFTLLSILGVHEFGHYFTARYYKAVVSLPYFIPAPPIVLFGTLGAILRHGAEPLSARPARRWPDRLCAVWASPPAGRLPDVRRAHPARDRDAVAELVRVGRPALLRRGLPSHAAARRRHTAHDRPARPRLGVPDPARAVDPARSDRVFVSSQKVSRTTQRPAGSLCACVRSRIGPPASTPRTRTRPITKKR